jgi:3-phenylpropionate/cinnamic acid dioxygenase small subunit
MYMCVYGWQQPARPHTPTQTRDPHTYTHIYDPKQVSDDRLKDLLADQAQAEHEKQQVQRLLREIRVEAAAVLAADRCVFFFFL